MQGIRVKVDEGREYYSLMDCWPLARFLSRKTSNNSGKVGMEKFFTYLKHYKNAKSHWAFGTFSKKNPKPLAFLVDSSKSCSFRETL